jgi:hypothetical protein
MAAQDGKWDFFVSYTQSDQAWAEWIAWNLEHAGYRVLIQAWDMVPGTNWVYRLDEGIRRARRTIAVASEAYLQSDWTRLEALGVLRHDPLSRDRRLLVVRVDKCSIEGPLGMIVRIDVFDLAEEAAHQALLSGVERAIRGRGKPAGPGEFPGAVRMPQSRGDAGSGNEEERLALAVDVDGYRQLGSTDRAHVRSRVLAMLFTVLQRAGAENNACVVVDRVDGLSLILPAGMTGSVAVATLVRELCHGVADVGQTARGQQPVRSRVGLARGTVNLTSWTFAGSATASARLLASSGQVRLAVSRSVMTANAVVVADDLYQDPAMAAVTTGFVRIPVSADAYGWIALLAGASFRGRATARPQLGAVTAIPVAVAAGALAAEEWQHLLDSEEALSQEEHPVEEGPVPAPPVEPSWPDPDYPGLTEIDPDSEPDHPWGAGDEDDPYHHWQDSPDEGSEFLDDSDALGTTDELY